MMRQLENERWWCWALWLVMLCPFGYHLGEITGLIIGFLASCMWFFTEEFKDG